MEHITKVKVGEDAPETIPYTEAVTQARLACRQFAMLYFHFVKVLYERLGDEEAKELTRQAIFELALDRSGLLREKAQEAGLPVRDELDFQAVSDLSRIAWQPAMGNLHCPYGEQWMTYYQDYPWFKEFAPFYCDVIDTTNIENFSKRLSHKLTENVLTGGESCRRVYFESDDVKNGKFTYGAAEDAERP
jgi:hypothetical protein